MFNGLSCLTSFVDKPQWGPVTLAVRTSLVTLEQFQCWDASQMVCQNWSKCIRISRFQRELHIRTELLFYFVSFYFYSLSFLSSVFCIIYLCAMHYNHINLSLPSLIPPSCCPSFKKGCVCVCEETDRQTDRWGGGGVLCSFIALF